MSLLKRLLLEGGMGGGAPAALIFPMEYLTVEGTSSPYDINYDDAIGSGPYLVAQTESPSSGLMGTAQNKLIRLSDGTLYACYSRQVAGKYQVHVKSSSDEGVTWGSEVLISTVAGMNINDQTASCMKVDADNNIRVVWHGRATGYTATKIWCASYNGSWSVSSPLDTGPAGMVTMNSDVANLAIDSNGDIHVVFRGRSTGLPYMGIWYVKYTGSWSVPIPLCTDAGMDTISQDPWTEIAIDSNDYVHVMFSGKSDAYPLRKQLFRAKYDGSWAVDHASNGLEAYDCAVPNIAIDSSDVLHVICVLTVWTPDRVYYLKYDGSWSVGLFLDPAESYASISVDSDDYINVIWLRSVDDTLWLQQYIVGWINTQLQPTYQQYPTIRRGNFP